MQRAPMIRHCTSQPLQFFGRAAELALLEQALGGAAPSVAALVGPGGQGKTAIVQHWLQSLVGRADLAGLFFWSFYRGKDSDLCLREWFAYAEGLERPPEVSASFCVDRLLPRLRQERWAVVLDGTEVVQHETGAWLGRFVHPELGRLVEELASAPLPGVLALTTRFPVPTLETRRHAQIISLTTLDLASAVGLLRILGVRGAAQELETAACAGGLHAKAVELIGAWLVRFHAGRAAACTDLPALAVGGDASAEEIHVARALTAFHQTLAPEARDILALATAFRQPPSDARLTEYLASAAVHRLLHVDGSRAYPPFAARPDGWLRGCIEELVALRLLERVREPRLGGDVLDAHPLVRRGFEDTLGGVAQGAAVRAGFLRGRPDRRPPQTLAEAREEVELFHAYADAGLWNEADSTFAALDNPKHRFLAPAFERDLLLRFFPESDWRQPPLWPGFGRWRSLAICFEMLGQFDEALALYRPEDAPLRGDALIALGRLTPLLDQPRVAHPWQPLWQAYRAHALALAGRTAEALELALAAVPQDIYEWVHFFEALRRLGRLDVVDLPSLLYRPPLGTEHSWSVLARRRLRADHAWLGGGELRGEGAAFDLDAEYRTLLDQYERAGLPVERVLTRLSFGRWLVTQGRLDEARALQQGALELTRRWGMSLFEADARALGEALDVARTWGTFANVPDAPGRDVEGG